MASALTFSIGNLGLIKPKNNAFATSPTPGVSSNPNEDPLLPNPFPQMPTPGGGQGSATSDAATQQAAQARLKEFAFNPKYAQQDQDFQRRAANAAQMKNARINDLDMDYKEATQEAGDVKTQAMRRLAERMASQGIFTSGIRVAEEGNVNQDFTRYLGDLEKRKLSGRNAALMDYSSEIDRINSTREAMYMQQVQEEEQARLQQEREKAAAIAAQQEADRQAALMQALIASQQQQTFSAPNIPPVSGGSIGAPGIPTDGYGGGQAPQGEPTFALPAGYFQTPGASRQIAEKFVVENIDRTLGSQPAVLSAVVNALSGAPQGITATQLSAIINAARLGEAAKMRMGRAF